MFASENIAAARASTVTLREHPSGLVGIPSRFLPDTLVDRNILHLHKLPKMWRDYEEALRTISAVGLWVSLIDADGRMEHRG